MNIHDKGSPASQIWVVVETPYDQDKDKQYVFSGGYGYTFDKMMCEAGISNYYVTYRRDLLDKSAYRVLENELNHFQPPIIICLEEAGKYFCPELTKRFSKGNKTDAEHESDIDKYCGSLLVSGKLSYPHYIIPTFLPSTIIKDWSQRDIVVSIDLGKAKSELDYFRQHGILEPYTERILKYDITDYNELTTYLDRFMSAKLISNDIESIYTRKKDLYYPHPGYPVTIGLADSINFGISFNLFRESKIETVDLWRRLAILLRSVPQLGQNFFNFDLSRYNSLGFDIPYENISDTLIRHHILWPELPHKLQFQTRQYTREPYYKDEGHGWNMKDMSKLRRYNCLDVCVTMEIYLEQEKEFNVRQYLR